MADSFVWGMLHLWLNWTIRRTWRKGFTWTTGFGWRKGGARFRRRARTARLSIHPCIHLMIQSIRTGPYYLLYFQSFSSLNHFAFKPRISICKTNEKTSLLLLLLLNFESRFNQHWPTLSSPNGCLRFPLRSSQYSFCFSLSTGRKWRSLQTTRPFRIVLTHA